MNEENQLKELKVEGNPNETEKIQNNNPSAKYQEDFSSDPESSLPTIDQIYDQCGYGYYQFKTILLVGFVLFLEGYYLTLIGSFLIPLKKFYDCDELTISVISCFVFTGVGIGSLLLSTMVKNCGRKYVLNTSVLNFLACSVSLYASTFYITFAISFFLLGISIGIIIPMSINILCEFLPVRLRASCLTGIWIGFSFGMLFQVLIMYFEMPNMREENLKPAFFIGLIVTCSMALIFILFIDNSPRCLLANKEYAAAFDLLEKMIKRNIPETVREQIKRELSQIVASSNQHPFEVIFGPEYFRISLINVILFFMSSVIFYGPILINTVSIKEFAKYNPDSSEAVLGESEMEGSEIRRGLFELSTLCAVGNIASAILVEIRSFGRIKTIFLGFFFCLLAVIGIVIYPQKFVTFLAMLNFAGIICFNSVITYSSEVYPTSVRDVATGFLFFCTRIGGVASQLLFLKLFEVDPFLPYYTIIAVTAVCTLSSCFYPYDTAGLVLDNHKPRGEKDEEKVKSN